MILPLLAALGSSRVISGRRLDKEVFTSGFKDLWHTWNLRGAVFLSLSIQVLLILTGSRRKHSHGRFLAFLTWIAYLTADSVATYAVGIITTKLMHSTNPSTDRDIELSVFWAPFLLLHLGGPGTITAYALEDNELWLRHFLSLMTQTGLTLYVFLMAWNGSNLSFSTIAMIFAGFCKYGERVWVLRAGSSKQFRDSIPEPPSNYTKVVEEQKLMEAEGFYVVPHEVNEVRQSALEYNLEGVEYLSDEKKPSKEEMYELLAARGLITNFQQLFADLLLSFQDRDTSCAIVKGKNFQVAFKIIEIELGFMFDMFYTKAKAIETPWGIARCIVVMLFSAVALVVFLSQEARDSYSPADVIVTFVLLGVAIFLEAYALMFLVLSDKAACWLIKNKKFKTLGVINRLQPLGKRRRWSGKVGQFSLLSFSLREKHLFCDKLLRLLKMDENIEKQFYKSYMEVSDKMKKLVFENFNERKSKWDTRGSNTLEKFDLMDELRWSIEMEFDQSILIWHIATELCFHRISLDIPSNEGHWKEISSLLSRYMMHLLVFNPFMLPMGIGRLKFKDTYVEAMKFFDEQQRNGGGVQRAAGHGEHEAGPDDHQGGHESRMGVACKALQNMVNTKLDLMIAKDDKSKYVLFHGCQLASELEKMGTKEGGMWKILSEVWVEMMAYAASKCKGSYHCQQLRGGGELLTHVWLLMAHFGLTDHFQIPHAATIAEFIVRP